MSSKKNSGATSNRLELEVVQGAIDDGFGLKEAIEETAKVYFHSVEISGFFYH